MSQQPAPPSSPSITLGELTPADADAFVRERSHDGVEFVDIDLRGVRAHDRELLECLLAGARLDDATLTGGRFRQTRWAGCQATTLRLDACTLRDVEIEGSRFGALDAYDSELRQVRLTQCRLGYVNLRGCRLTDVALEGCHVEDLDLGSARVERLALTDCTVGHLSLSEAELTDVDLRRADLSQISAPERLAGSTITETQLTQLAPLLASHLGIEIDN